MSGDGGRTDNHEASEFDLKTEMTRMKLPSDLVAMMCGVSRVTVWRWRTKRQHLPGYVRTVLRQLNSIRNLSARLHEK